MPSNDKDSFANNRNINPDAAGYGADEIETLESIDAVRKNTGMYVGTTQGEDGAHHLWVEIFGNANDEITAGYATSAWTIIHEDGSIEVRDNGRGIPPGPDPKSPVGDSTIRHIFTSLHSGSKFNSDKSAYKTASVGMHGVGTCITNALSLRLDVSVYRDGKVYEMSFRRGVPGIFSGKNGDSKFKATPPNERAVRISDDKRPAAERKLMPTGTSVHFWPDPILWTGRDVSDPNTKRIHEEILSTSYMIADGTFYFSDLRNDIEDVYSSPGGLKDKITKEVGDMAISPVLSYKDTAETTVVVPELDDTGDVIGQREKVDTIRVEAALAYVDSDQSIIRGYVNTKYIKNDGTSVDGFRLGIKSAVSDYIKKNSKSVGLRAKEDPSMLILKDIVDCGLVGDISVMIPNPDWGGGQTKDEIQNPELRGIVSRLTRSHLNDWFNDPKNNARAKNIAKKCIEAMRIRLREKAARETEKKKSDIERATSMPSKLSDCLKIGDEHSELLICEGDSASGSIKGGRMRDYQAIFPIKGKILNVYNTSYEKMISNAECTGIITAIGAGHGAEFDISQSRYHNVIIYADADEDGNHIRCLLITFFWKYMRPIIEQGRFYTAVPPLYTIKVTSTGETILIMSEEEKEKKIAELTAKKIKFQQPNRLKGLGEMDPEELWKYSLNPETRTLRRITVGDAVMAESMLQLAMGKDSKTASQKRREWIVDELGLEYINYDEL